MKASEGLTKAKMNVIIRALFAIMVGIRGANVTVLQVLIITAGKLQQRVEMKEEELNESHMKDTSRRDHSRSESTLGPT